MKRRALMGALALLVVAGVFAAALPVFASPATAGLGIGLRWLGIGGRGSTVADAAAVLGMTEDDVWAAKAEGKTLAVLAQEQGMTADELAQKIVSAREAEVDALLKEGKITVEAAAAAKANIEANVQQAISTACTGCGTGNPATGNAYGRGQQAGQGTCRMLGQNAGTGLQRGPRAGR